MRLLVDEVVRVSGDIACFDALLLGYCERTGSEVKTGNSGR